MENNGNILITGASGKTGSRIARRLVQLGYPVLTAGRGIPRIDSAEHVHFDWNDRTTFGPALSRTDRVYLVAPIAVMDPSRVMLPFLETALEAGVKRFVLLSSASVPEDGPVFGPVHQAIRQLAPEWTVLRPSYFMQNFTEGQHAGTMNREGILVTATGEGRIGFVHADDIAEVGVRALIDEQPHNTEHLITGPEALSYGEAAAIIGAATGRPIRHVHVDSKRLAEDLTRLGLPGDYASFLAGLDDAIRTEGTEDLVTDTVERVTGHPPVSLAEFAASHAAAWKVTV
ncbi:NmrA family NAD(P)-binding protein [Paenibacillus sp. P26]|nr:NmrA family NAD(P)-binding protein [Paenibacillus sp. P26]UUZ94054.1 NmrA family NAD(P)-binding protein [Paenibacillus sp. P25]